MLSGDPSAAPTSVHSQTLTQVRRLQVYNVPVAPFANPRPRPTSDACMCATPPLSAPPQTQAHSPTPTPIRRLHVRNAGRCPTTSPDPGSLPDPDPHLDPACAPNATQALARSRSRSVSLDCACHVVTSPDTQLLCAAVIPATAHPDPCPFLVQIRVRTWVIASPNAVTRYLIAVSRCYPSTPGPRSLSVQVRVRGVPLLLWSLHPTPYCCVPHQVPATAPTTGRSVFTHNPAYPHRCYPQTSPDPCSLAVQVRVLEAPEGRVQLRGVLAVAQVEGVQRGSVVAQHLTHVHAGRLQA